MKRIRAVHIPPFGKTSFDWSEIRQKKQEQESFSYPPTLEPFLLW